MYNISVKKEGIMRKTKIIELKLMERLTKEEKDKIAEWYYSENFNYDEKVRMGITDAISAFVYNDHRTLSYEMVYNYICKRM